MKQLLPLLLLALTFAPPAVAQTPDKREVVAQLAREGPGAEFMAGCRARSKESCAAFTRLVACTLEGDGFGLLSKSGAENNVRGFAVDAIIHERSVQVVDVIGSSEDPGARPDWSLVAKRASNNFVKPIECGAAPPPPPPPTSDLETRIRALEERVAALEADKPGPTDPPPSNDDLLAVVREQLATTKAILELLKKTAGRFGVQ